MKNKKIIFALTITTLLPLLSSCGMEPFKPWEVPSIEEKYIRPDANKFNEVLDLFSRAIRAGDAEQTKGYYDQLQNYLNYVLELRENVSNRESALEENRVGSELTFLYNYYWTLKSKEISAVQKGLNSLFNKKMVKEILGEEASQKYSAISTNKMFINRTYKHYKEDHVTSQTDKIFRNVNNPNKGTGLLLALSSAAMNLYDLIEAYSICTARSNLDTTDNYYNKELTYITNLVLKSQNEYKRAIIALINSPHRDLMIETLGQDQVDMLEQTSVLSEQLLNIQEKETELVNSYASLNTEEKKELYVELLKNRRLFVNTLNLQTNSNSKINNYIEYAYQNVFYRDYKPIDALTLASNILNNLLDIWEKSKQHRQSIPGKVGEKELWKALEATDGLLPNSREIRDHIKDYGLYCFDSNPNSYDGAFVLSIPSLMDEDYYMLINTSNTINDYTTAIHEFGHYYANMVEDDALSTSSYPSLDLSEMHSQTLEMLMMNHYDDFIPKDSIDDLKKNQVGNALWALFSGSCVSEFEIEAAKETDPLVKDIDDLWKRYAEKYSIDNYNISYEMIPHIYQQPGYYISYVTSMVSSLEIFNHSETRAFEIYTTLAKKGSYNPYIKTLQSLELNSPFVNSYNFTPLVNEFSAILD